MATELVEQHANTKRLEVRNHGNRIVVAKHPIDVAAKRFTQMRYDFKAGLAVAIGAPAIVTRKHTKIVVEVVRELGNPLHGAAA